MSTQRISGWLAKVQVGRAVRWLAPNGGTLLIVALLLMTQSLWARPLAAPNAPGPSATEINYQANAADSEGNPITGEYAITFTIYDALTGGNVIWGPEIHPVVNIQDGLFSVGLGSILPGGIPTTVWDGDRYLEVTIGSQTLAPRELIRAVPIAHVALQALTVPDGTIGTTQIADRSITSEKIAPTAWIDLPLASGFKSPPNADWQKAQYRLVGDIVHLRGLITKESGDIADNTVVALLPEGFRPPKQLGFVAEGHDGLTSKHRVDIVVNGNIEVDNTAGGTPHVSLDGIFFSITP